MLNVRGLHRIYIYLCAGSPSASSSSTVSTQTVQPSSSRSTSHMFHAMLAQNETDAALKKTITTHIFDTQGVEAALQEVRSYLTLCLLGNFACFFVVC